VAIFSRAGPAVARLVPISLAAFFLMLAVRAYLGRFERLFQDGTVFAGVTYTRRPRHLETAHW